MSRRRSNVQRDVCSTKRKSLETSPSTLWSFFHYSQKLRYSVANPFSSDYLLPPRARVSVIIYTSTLSSQLRSLFHRPSPFPFAFPQLPSESESREHLGTKTVRSKLKFAKAGRERTQVFPFVIPRQSLTSPYPPVRR